MIKAIKKFLNRNRNISIITIVALFFCIVCSILKCSKKINVPYWLYPWGELGYWISISIIAATIFYVFQTYIPALMAENLNRLAMAITYRKLQLLLVRLDDLIIEPYKKIKNATEVDISFDDFFNASFLKSILTNFDLSQNSPCHYMQHLETCMSYKDYFISQWNEAKTYAKDALITPYAQTNPELSYQLEYLASENSINKVLTFLQKGQNIEYSCILGLNQLGDEVNTNNLENIKVLHQIAFSLYDNLKEDKRLKNIYQPLFYTPRN